jgi:HPt (histidine-containing phosphotransfer) domain-containing protein
LPTQTEPPPERACEVFDKAALILHVGGDGELLKEIVELFLETAPPLLRGIQSAVGRGDGRGLKTAAHTMRGSAKDFYAPTLERAALVLEQIGESQAFDGAEIAYAVLEKEFNKLSPSLLSMLRESKQGARV